MKPWLIFIVLVFPVFVQAAENPVVAKLRARAEQGVPGAQYNLAELYAHGTIVPQNAEVAFSWYQKSAQLGFRDAQFAVAMAYLEGNGVAKDPIEGLAWIKIAAINGGFSLVRFRDRLDKELSPEIVAGAERRREEIGREIEDRKLAKLKNS